jgi:hypothetical protein
MDLNIYAFVGHDHADRHREKNAIMQIDFALRGRAQRHAVGSGDLSRLPDQFRPIMMTTIAALLGACQSRSVRCLVVRHGVRSVLVVVGGLPVLAARDARSDSGVLHIYGAGAAPAAAVRPGNADAAGASDSRTVVDNERSPTYVRSIGEAADIAVRCPAIVDEFQQHALRAL